MRCQAGALVSQLHGGETYDEVRTGQVKCSDEGGLSARLGLAACRDVYRPVDSTAMFGPAVAADAGQNEDNG